MIPLLSIIGITALSIGIAYCFRYLSIREKDGVIRGKDAKRFIENVNNAKIRASEENKKFSSLRKPKEWEHDNGY